MIVVSSSKMNFCILLLRAHNSTWTKNGWHQPTSTNIDCNTARSLLMLSVPKARWWSHHQIFEAERGKIAVRRMEEDCRGKSWRKLNHMEFSNWMTLSFKSLSDAFTVKVKEGLMGLCFVVIWISTYWFLEFLPSYCYSHYFCKIILHVMVKNYFRNSCLIVNDQLSNIFT